MSGCWRETVLAIIDCLLPRACAICERGIDRGVLCAACHASLDTPVPPPLEIGGLTVHAAIWHRGAGRALVHALKYRGRRDVAPLLARRMRILHPHAGSGGRLWLVPVPLHRRRLLARGYNQAELLAAALARELDGDWLPLLVRRRTTGTQTRLQAAARRRNVDGAFAVRAVRTGGGWRERLATLRLARAADRRPGPPSELVLLDDVVTTGATLLEARRTLERHGHRVTAALVAARVAAPAGVSTRR